MSLWELVLIAVGLSMDAFAVAVCKGLSMEKASGRKCLVIALYFGVFQAVMPLLGYWAGSAFAHYITAFDHWIAFALLAFIGGKMVWESRAKHEESPCEPSLAFREMLPLALATSIDALAVGISFAFLGVDILPPVCLIGLVTFALSFLGVKLGHVFGAKFKAKAELAGGIILILLGLKILLEHLGVLQF